VTAQLTYFYDGKSDEAVKKLNGLIKRNRKSSPPYVTQGKLFWKTGKRDLAVETWGNGYAETGNMIFLFLLEDFYLKEEEPEEIIDIYNKLVTEEPDNSILQTFFGKLYMRLEMTEEALERLKKANELEPVSNYLPQLLGETYYRMKKYKESADNFKDAFGFARMIRIPFICSSCGSSSVEWHGSCPGCGGWDTLSCTDRRGQAKKA